MSRSNLTMLMRTKKTRRYTGGQKGRLSRSYCFLTNNYICIIFIFVAFVSSYLTPLCEATPCPNSCNGHGVCQNAKRVCECYNGYEGSDCSRLSCPKGKAWADFAIGEDNAHNDALCSNMGICDSVSGSCICRVGFEGIACERMSCPEDCLQRGKCISMRWNAETLDPGIGSIGDGGVFELQGSREYKTPWDAEKIFGCHCGANYNGPDCSLQNCPNGDDPLTGSGISTPTNPAQFNDIQRVECHASGGTFTLAYKGETTVPIPFNSQASVVRTALENLETVNGVTITMYGSQTCLETGTSFTLEFTQDFGNIPLLQTDASKLTLPGQTVQLSISKQQAGSKEDEVCSRRGNCDTSSGSCICAANFDTSNGYNLPGTRGDCGYALATIQGCPGAVSCSAHGTCSGFPTFVCDCNEGWTGADCSEKTCPRGTSWYTTPSANNEAHIFEAVECSDMGSCDRSSGTCTCISGFTGTSCNRLSCPGQPNTCNSHGACQDMMTLASNAKVNGVVAGFTYGLIPNNPLTWDYNRVFGCNCDDGWHGYDCSLRSCLNGDDPNSQGQLDEIQSLRCINAAGKSGVIVFTFRGENTGPIASSATTAQVKASLELLPTITYVSVELAGTSTTDSLCTPQGNTFFVSFLTEHGDLPMLSFNLQDIDTFSVEEIVKGNKENIECSGRGNCDTTTGTCFCYTGYGSSDGQGNSGVLNDCGYILPQPFNGA